MSRPLRVLIVEDSADDAALLLAELRRGDFDPSSERVETAEAMRSAFDGRTWDVILSDYRLPHFSGPAALALAKELGLDAPFIMVSGTIGEETAVAALKAGADDFVTKDNLSRLCPAIDRELREAVSRRDLRRAQDLLRHSEAHFRALIEHGMDLTVVLDAGGRLRYSSPSATPLLGYEPTELAGEVIFAWLHPDDRARIQEVFSLAAADRTRVIREEFRFRHKDGSWRIFEAVVSNLLDDPAVMGLVINSRDITERKRMEEALAEREERFRQITENMREAFWIAKADLSELLYVSPAFEQILGRRRESLQRDLQTFFSAIHPDDRAQVMADLASISGGVGADGRVFRVLRPGGEIRWVLARTVPVRNSTGEIYRLTGVVQDITDSRRAEEELRASQAHLQSIFSGIDDAIFVHDLEGQIIDCNEAACRRLGYSREELLAMLTSDVDAPEFAAGFRERIEEQLRSGRFTGEGVHVSKDGRRIPVDINSCLIDYNGEKVVLAAMRDVSERRRAEEALRRSEADYRGVVEHASLGIFRSTPDGRFLTVNRALVAMLGYPFAVEVLGLDIARDVYADPVEYAGLVAQFAQHEEARAEVHWRRKDGTPISVKLNVHLVRDTTGEIECFESLVEDVTEQRSLESQFRQAQRLEAVGRLAGGVAHDFNNVLTAITGYSELLLEDLGPEDPKRSDVEEIKAAALRATALTRQLLAFSRKQVLQPRVLDLNAAVRTLEKMLRRLIGEDVKLEVLLAPTLSAVRADPGQIEQVVLNLAVNSRDAMPTGGRLTIETADVDLDESYARTHGGVSPGRYVMLAVSDTGVGMDAATRMHIFEPFFTTKEAGMGTGLGLATVHGIVKQSGGHIWVYSEVGLGATFKIYLPQVDDLPESAEPAASVQSVAGGLETVLVAEDDRFVRELVTQTLSQKGYRVLRAPDGQAALEIGRGEPGEIHVLVTDLVMPGMTGRELAEKLTAERPGLRVLYMSGYTDDTVVRHGVLEQGMPYLQKPFAPRALASKVREVLDRPRAPIAATLWQPAVPGGMSGRPALR